MISLKQLAKYSAYALGSCVVFVLIAFLLGGDMLAGFAGGSNNNTPLEGALFTTGVFGAYISIVVLCVTGIALAIRRFMRKH